MDRPSPNPWVSSVPWPQHGSAVGSGISARFDFSQNLNPLGPPPQLLWELRDAVRRACDYPEMDSGTARRALGQWLAVDPASIVLGNGSSESIGLISLAFLSAGRRAIVLRPSYIEYQRASLSVGSQVVQIDLKADTGFRWHPDEISVAVGHHMPSIVWLGNPHNPTGQIADLDALRYLALKHRNTLWVVDEAYVELSAGPSALPLIELGNVVVLRSLTKAYALPGIRAGFAVAAVPIAEILLRLALPWNVNVVAQTLATLAPQYASHVERGAQLVSLERMWLEEQLRLLGIEVVPSEANFVLATAQGFEDLSQCLLKRGIMVRDCSSLGLERYVRIAVRPRFELEVLLTNLREVIK